MPKMLWVALPLLVAALLMAVQLLRRRPPSRLALNVASSVLLLGYLATTAGLGIYWVANQQLPVFDWHYLFGYTTVLLVVLHLSFNFRVVWRYLTRRRAAAVPVARGAAVPGRRRLLHTAGVLLAAAGAFVLGQRYGRDDWRAPGAGPGSAGLPGVDADGAAAAAMALIERFHAHSSHARQGLLLRAPSVVWGAAPPDFKPYRAAPRVVLPPARGTVASGLGLAALGAVLWHTAGVTASRGGTQLRASPSSGALFSTELYVVARAVPGLAAGLWHYDPRAHALERLHDVPPADAALGAPDEPALRGAEAAVVATAVFRRTGHKYRDRTYRYVLADLGHALWNLRVAADALMLQARLVARFDESRAAATLGVDEAEEGVLALVALRPRSAVSDVAMPAAPGDAAPPSGSPRDAALPSGSLRDAAVPSVSPGDAALPSELPRDAATPSALPRNGSPRWHSPPATLGDAAPLGVTGAVHAATSLRAAVAPLPTPADPLTAPLPAGAVVLPTVAAARVRVLDVIAARRSVRRYAATPLTLADLSAVLGAMAGAGRAEAAPLLSHAVRIDVVAHAVTGLRPGAYRYDADARALLPRRMASAGPAALRRAARAAALDQDVIGDAAVVFVLAIARAAFAADPAGPARGYRHAYIEAGLVGERIYLEAGARGLGACAVGAFYDDEAAALVGIDPAHEWAVHFAALGVPA